MMIKPDLLKYHQSIAHQLEAVKDRIRHLIGAQHWPTEGEYKEIVLRNVLRSFIDDHFRVGRGFVVSPTIGTTGQIDILITDCSKPTLFRDGDLAFVTPSAVKSVLEVKTKIHGKGPLKEALINLAENAAIVRGHNAWHCEVGLFVYEDNDSISDEAVLDLLKEVREDREERSIDFIALGASRFFRYWREFDPSQSTSNPYKAFHAYQLEKLAPAYFIGNVVFGVCGTQSEIDFKAWFPIEETKESRCTGKINLNNSSTECK